MFACFVQANNRVEWFVDVEDSARLIVIALTHSRVENERLFGVAELFDFNLVLATFRKLYPKRKFHDDFPDAGRNLSVFEGRERANDLLKQFWGRGYLSLEESLAANARQVAE